MNSPVKLFIVEGEDRDFRFVSEMTKCFFLSPHVQSKIIHLPAAQNIYMLYKELEKDDFDTDVVEVLREKVPLAKKILDGISRQDIDEIFLFFDYDVHQNNIKHQDYPHSSYDVLEKMFEVFDNETENGKLYISYPMVEALYDYQDTLCESFSSCFISINDVSNYKNIAGYGNPNASHRMDIASWKSVLNIFALRVKCLFNLEELDFSTYRKWITPMAIYKKEYDLMQEAKNVFVLSAFPEFLFDYYKIDFWKTMTPIKKYRFDSCPK